MTSKDWVKVLGEDGSEAALLAYCDWLADQEGWEDAAEAARGLPALVADIQQSANRYFGCMSGVKILCKSNDGECSIESTTDRESPIVGICSVRHLRAIALIADVSGLPRCSPCRPVREWFKAALNASACATGRYWSRYGDRRYAKFRVRAEVAREAPSLSDAVPF